MSWKVEWNETQVKVARKNETSYQIYKLTTEPHCTLCGRTLIRGKHCWDYYRHSKLALCDGVFQLGDYYSKQKLDKQEKEDYLTQYILALKNGEEYAEPIGVAMALMIKNRYSDILSSDFFIPIPSYANGYNQSLFLCQRISESLNRNEGTSIAVLEPLIKIKDVKLHSLQTRAEREEAAKGMFDSNDKIKTIIDKKITIIDDLLTTGITMNECIKILRNYRPSKIWVYVAAGNL